jgi:hypothetical protein
VPQLASSHAQPQHLRRAAASFGVERGARVSLPSGGLRAQRMTHVTWLSCGSRVATTQARSPRDDDGDDYEPEIKVSGVVVVGGSGNGEEDLPALGVHWLFYAGISDASSLSLVDIPATSFAAVHHNNCTDVLMQVCMRCAYDQLGVCVCVCVCTCLLCLHYECSCACMRHMYTHTHDHCSLMNDFDCYSRPFSTFASTFARHRNAWLH